MLMLPDDAVVEVGHREDEVEIVPLQHAVGDSELPEAARRRYRRMPGCVEARRNGSKSTSVVLLSVNSMRRRWARTCRTSRTWTVFSAMAITATWDYFSPSHCFTTVSICTTWSGVSVAR
jgi:hypothetical protein